ncbi:hypothetical protein GCM10009555_064460 [Acrocarpospora macrocephala]|uniref:Uncharacterized protein n=1 Tax=Acrocarpospora macrocephala TaxID=150177 RepID=A0A5M3WHB3_9ACTN|nr:hypothetical protein [Acrocarpospora macrocephala]GES07619.1 hypothetical protein Amac_012140 [Acrocarpospora macrocephala]
MENIAYVHERFPVTQDQIEHWQVIPDDNGRLPTLVGTCPMCHHDNEIRLAEWVTSSGGVPSMVEDSAAATSVTRQIICTCRMGHEQPPGFYGCGRWWLGTLTVQSGGGYRLTVEAEHDMLAAAVALNHAVDGQDRSVQSSAEKWVTGVASVFGLFSLVGVATAKDALSGFTNNVKLAVAAALLTGLGLAATALALGHRAAYGWPVAVDVSDNRKLQAWYDDRRTYATRAARLLRSAVWFAYGALAALAIMTMLIWFLPRAPR